MHEGPMKNHNATASLVMTLRNGSILLCMASFAGCASPEPPPSPAPTSYSPPPRYSPADDPQPHYTILVESSPPGARIEFNDAFVGTTPCRIRVPGGVGRKFSSGKILGHDFKALPLPSGGSTQIKRFDAGSDIPEHLFFDMRLSYR